MENKHIGSSFDSFLQDEGLMAEVETTALKRVLAYQIKQEMELRHITKTTLAKMMKTSRSSVDRLLDPKNSSVTLLTLENVAVALGKKLILQFA